MIFRFYLNNKGCLFASFIIFSLLSTFSFANQTNLLIQKAFSKNLDKSDIWRSLLHTKNGQRNILDPHFILSSDDFSLSNELRETINFLFSKDTSTSDICRFPARYIWLKKELELSIESFAGCSGYTEFINMAPLDDLYLIYASENLTSPSSMMGHIFLKTTGVNTHSTSVSHSLSFFTEIQGINIPKLLFDSLVIGKKGYFSLTPYNNRERTYLVDEQRNIWSYHLALSKWQKELLHAHLWELKDTELTYFFHDYNCATFTLYVLSVAEPRFLNYISSIDSPIDVAKAAKEIGVIDQTLLTPSSKWKARMLTDALAYEDVSLVKHAVKDDQFELLLNQSSPERDFLKTELAHTYAQYLYEEGQFTDKQLKAALSNIAETTNNTVSDFTIDLSDYKDPLKSQEDSQFYSGLVSIEGKEYFQLGFLAAAKKREDDSRQYFGETDLRLFDLSLLVPVEQDSDIKLDEFSLYSVSSLMPWDRLTGGISGRFSVGARTHFNQDLEQGSAFDLSGGIGLSYALHKDILTYSLFSSGYGLRAGKSYIYTEPELGFVINEVFDMKSILSIKHIWNQDKSGDAYFKAQFNQSLYLTQKLGLFLGYERAWKDSLKQERFDMKLKYYF